MALLVLRNVYSHLIVCFDPYHVSLSVSIQYVKSDKTNPLIKHYQPTRQKPNIKQKKSQERVTSPIYKKNIILTKTSPHIRHIFTVDNKEMNLNRFHFISRTHYLNSPYFFLEALV